ncbi:MAG TPA: serine hydrolase domain-containing protein [Pseudonocardiaceae bacterium]|nr:serine hydrolase domain-containing protein [Pseudonocardiaceae bacterium]
MLTDLLRRLSHDHHVPGAQLAIYHNGEAASAWVGEEEQDSGRAIAVNSRIPVGSIGKMFLAAIAMILVADDDLALAEPVGHFLDELTGPAARLAGTITLRQLLSHTSGLPSGLDDEQETPGSVRRYLAERADRIALVCAPGAGFSYSNLGYLLVARIIEEITGLSWNEAVESLLLNPLGIEPSYVVAPSQWQPRSPTASGHAVNPVTGVARPIDQTLTAALAPAGALAMSAEDLVAFARLHLHADRVPGVPLDLASVQEMHRAVPGAIPFGLADGWGLGMAVFRDGNHCSWVGHDGTADGTSCHLRIDPAGGRIVALTTNADTGIELWQDLLDELRSSYFPVATYTPKSSTNRPVPLSAGFFGRYVNGDTEYAVSVREDGCPYVAVAGEIYPDLTLYDRGEFSVRHPESGRPIAAGRFLSHPSTGRVSGLQTGGRIARRLESVS